MIVETNDLMTVSNYARREQVAVNTVYKWIKSGKVTEIIIDGVKFIKK